jgi:NAD(P)-dependent dehydrogenase (short-subunit alcohol dehydrogenase family)
MSGNQKRFAGKSVLVTGSGSGIGQQSALQFAREGGSVTVVDIDESAAEKTAAMIQEEGGIAQVCVADVSDPVAVAAMVKLAISSHGGLHVLHNNAYWAPLGATLTQTSVEQWERTIAVTLTGVFLGCKFAIPQMLSQGSGAIVNTASAASHAAGEAFSAYAAAKGGVLALTRSVALDYGRQGIRCNCVSPGFTRTPATASIFDEPPAVEAMLSRIPLHRPGEPEDIANTVLFLASDESAYLTGQSLVVDGGRLAAW